MVETLIMFLIYAIIIAAVAFLLLWLVDRFFPEFARPARIIVGVIVLVAVLVLLLRVLGGVDLVGL